MEQKIVYTPIITKRVNNNDDDKFLCMFFNKEDAKNFCKDTIRKIYAEIYQKDNPTVEDILRFSLDNRYSLDIRIYEEAIEQYYIDYRGNTKYLINLFNKVIKLGGEDLYNNLLSIVYNCTEYNYIMQEINHYTDGNIWCDNNNEYLTKEECVDGIYKGIFRFRNCLDVRSKQIKKPKSLKKIRKFMHKSTAILYVSTQISQNEKLVILSESTSKNGILKNIAYNIIEQVQLDVDSNDEIMRNIQENFYDGIINYVYIDEDCNIIQESIDYNFEDMLSYFQEVMED